MSHSWAHRLHVKLKQVKLWAVGALAILASAPSPAVPADEFALAKDASTFESTVPNQTPLPSNAPKGMVWIPGGEFSMGCKVPSPGDAIIPGPVMLIRSYRSFPCLAPN